MRGLIILLICSAGFVAAAEIPEQSAVTHLKRTVASVLDPALPSRPFGAWVSDKFRNWDIEWISHPCGEVSFTNKKGKPVEEVPICVQVTITQPGQKVHDESSDGFQVLVLVGTEKRGLVPNPKVLNIVRMNGDEVERVHGMTEVEP